jgi:hypothetical protein
MSLITAIADAVVTELNGAPAGTFDQVFRNAIKYAVVAAAQSVVIGPDHEVAADSGAAHEFGGPFRQEQYQKRPFMGPALEKVKDRLPRMWAASVKG